MKPLLFRWRTLTIWSYPAMLYIGLNLGVVAGNLAAHAAGIDAFHVFAATIVLVVPALIGTRLLFVLSHWHFYRQNPGQAFSRNQGGARQYGGFALMLPLSVPLLRALHLPFGAFWDCATFTILVTMIVGRVGCLMQGCCAGRPFTGWCGVRLPNHLGVWQRRIPTQFLEAAWAAVLLIGGVTVWRKLPFPGAFFLLATAAYGGARAVMESWREQTSGAANKLTVYQSVSVAMTVLALAALLVRWPK
jgi:phosphatidylglycerol:prolipoprotein diacylglycerol transferase